MWWSSYKMVYGSRSTHIPRLYGKRTANRPDGQQPAPPSVGFENIDVGDMTLEIGPMTQSQTTSHWLRNSYKQHAYVIRNALMTHGNLEASYPISRWTSLPSLDDSDDEEDEEDEEDDDDDDNDYHEGQDEDDEEIPPCPRYDEIKNYLVSQKSELAIETMKFRMPEHTLHQYIRRNGGIYLSSEEWRGFLLNCTERKELFQIRNKNGKLPTPYHAIIRLLNDGWPKSSPVNAAPINVAVTNVQAECFFDATQTFLAERKEPCCGPRGIVRKLPGPSSTASRKRQAEDLQQGPPSKHRHRDRSQ
ncbi:hypothetical protein EYC80_003132 [Monilinia laxa]|uniref:Uncharacterized protein n=1 Tax=Monilinia laxa TaxID=61186 RepID=A0A5N6KD02_MONLA|nr:hypothetical protein EYC80_003132 [Monilinia laxa]